MSLILPVILSAAENWDIFPDAIKTIAIIAPGKPAVKSQVDKVLKNLQAAGYRVKVMPNARLGESPAKLKKVPWKLRHSDLMQAWFDPQVDAIWCMRGGNYAQDLVNRLDYDKLRTRPMIIIGFSNITVLHQALQKNNVGRVFSGPSVTSMLRTDAFSRAWFKKALAGESMPPIQLTALRAGACSGKAAGGHITMLHWAVRDGYAMSTKDRIVFLEANTKGLKINSSILDKLIAAGYFNECKAVVFGEFSGMSKGDQLDMFKKFTAKVQCPVYYGYPYGHGTANCLIDMDRVKSIDNNAVLRQ